MITRSTLEQIIRECHPGISLGQTASYIPELASQDPDKLGICIVTKGGEECYAGDCFHRFTIQSIAKPIILLQALMDNGTEPVRSLVGVEATGKPFDAFHHSDQVLTGAHINPMINTGAIALCTLIHGNSYREKFSRLLDLTRKLSGNPTLAVDEAVFLSEKMTGNKNRALAYMLKAYGMIQDSVEDILDCYFRACSISADCRDLSRIGCVFACHGTDPKSSNVHFPAEYARYINASLVTCGMYDGSGDFALDVGFPAKSGVGGGIMGSVPHRMGIGVYSPALDKRGNSTAGIQALTRLSAELDLSIF